MKGIDIIIDEIKTGMASLTWIEMSYGRAFLHQEKRDGKTLRLPKCWIKGEYLNLLPNDNFKAMSFIACKGPEKLEQQDLQGDNYRSRDLSVIVWVNQTKISNNGEYILSELRADVQGVLENIIELSSINAIYDEKADDIFLGYTLDDVSTQYLMYPYGGLRFDVTVKFRDACE